MAWVGFIMLVISVAPRVINNPMAMDHNSKTQLSHNDEEDII